MKLASNNAMFDARREGAMRTTVTLDDELVAKAMAYSGINEVPELMREALKRLVAREAANRLAKLGGSDPNATLPPRRRFE